MDKCAFGEEMTMKLREKLINQYLPLWAKETVLRENKRLMTENNNLKQANRELQAYLDGINLGARYVLKLPNEGE
jgi:uncharacterized protein YhaN